MGELNEMSQNGSRNLVLMCKCSVVSVDTHGAAQDRVRSQLYPAAASSNASPRLPFVASQATGNCIPKQRRGRRSWYKSVRFVKPITKLQRQTFHDESGVVLAFVSGRFAVVSSRSMLGNPVILKILL